MSWTGLTSFTLKFWINQNLNPIAWILLNEETETSCFIFQPVLRNMKLGMMLDPMCGHHDRPQLHLVCKQWVMSSSMNYLSRVMRNPTFCICENKDADHLRGNREADQRLCFRYIDSTIPLPPKSEISSLQPSSVVVQTGLCGTKSKPPKTSFPTTRLILLLARNLYG